jgi:hypothetical protein
MIAIAYIANWLIDIANQQEEPFDTESDDIHDGDDIRDGDDIHDGDDINDGDDISEETITKEGDRTKTTRTIISITEPYYNQNLSEPNPNIFVKQKHIWMTSNLSRWSAEWRIPKDLIYEAMEELTELEEITLSGNITNQELTNGDNKELYQTLIDRWTTPEKFWEAVFKLIKIDNEQRVELISNVFQYAINKHNLSSNEAIDMVTSFVQHIRYQIPSNYFEILPPLNSVSSDFGDCDTKAILLAMVFEDLGYESVVLYSSHYLHAMCAVYLNGFGDYIEYKGIKYSLIETTSTGWLVGMIPSEVDDLRYWYVIDL